MASEIRPALSVVVLCYRSEEELVPVVEKLLAMLSLLSISWEVILVGNYLAGSDDTTPDVVRRLEREHSSIKAIVREKKGMMGWDMPSGLEAARGECLAVIDGDGQFPFEAILTCFARLREGRYDMVQTYRVRREDGPARRLISWAYNRIARGLFPDFPLQDVNSKPKVLVRSLYEKLRLEDDGWFIDAEIVLKANLLGARIGHEPIHFYRLEGRSSFVKPEAVREFVRKLLAFRKNRGKIKVRLEEGAQNS